MKKFIVFLITLYSFSPGCQKTAPKFVTHTIPKQQWVGGLSSVFNGMKLHLNNYTPRKHEFESDDNYAYENPKSSSLAIPSLGSVPVAFDVPVTRQDPYSIYVNDINSSSFGTDAYNGEAYITIAFESDGVEIMGDCVNNIICICGSPQIDLDNPSVVIPLDFQPSSDGSLKITSGNVAFTATASESGPCVNNACSFLCDVFAPNRNTDMQTAIEKFIGDYVDNNSGLISGPFVQYLKTLGVNGPIVSFQIQSNGDLNVQDKE